jgi:DNA-damage-inducible protein D
MIGLLSKEKVEFALSQLLKAEVNETVMNCNGLKMVAEDGKMRITDVADTEQLFRLIQSIPPKIFQ